MKFRLLRILKSFRSKILISFFTFIIILSTWVAFYFSINNKQKKLQNFSIELTAAENQFLEGGRHLQYFILAGYHQPDFYKTQKQKDIDAFLSDQRKNIRALKRLKINAEGTNIDLDTKLQNLSSLHQTLTDSVRALKSLYFKKGFKDFGTEGRMREFAHLLGDKKLIPEVDLLRLRRHEKDYMLRGEASYVEKFNGTINKLINAHQTGSTSHDALINYKLNFNIFVIYNNRLGVLTNKGVYKEVQQIIGRLSTQYASAREEASKKVDSLQDSFRAVLIGVSFFLIITVIVLSLFLSKLLTKDIKELNKRMLGYVNSRFKDEGDENENLFIPTITEIEHLNRHFMLLKKNLKSTLSNLEVSNTDLVKQSENQQALYEELQVKSEELEHQQEELRAINDELLFKSQSLQSSEEELRQTNTELEEKAEELEERNRLVDQARNSINQKVVELEIAGKYKTEFLANMSHELRTPLNSILILAGILKENKKSNLNEDEAKYASVIQNAGKDLLNLINDILDLSKIESGKVDLAIEDIELWEIKNDIELLFKEVANNKNIQYTINIGSTVPAIIISDRTRLDQIIKNLLSNAFKFTPDNGAVSLNIDFAQADIEFNSFNLSDSDAKAILAFSVKDTGIGIPLDKQKVIFEAFKQADGSTSRKYGGTGLGLSISKELSTVLGGEIQLSSAPDEGSIFTLYLPLAYHQDYLPNGTNEDMSTPEVAVVNVPSPIILSKQILKPVIESVQTTDNKEHVMLIVENDVTFANILKNHAIERGFKPILTDRVDIGLEMAFEHLPDSIILDIMLPGMEGLALFKKLKENSRTKNIPIHMMSASDGKLINTKSEPQEDLDCITLCENVHEVYGLETNNRAKVLKHPHIKISPSKDELIDELALFMNKVQHTHTDSSTPQVIPKKVKPIVTLEKALTNKSVLVVDDDMRNVFALTSVLKSFDMNIEIAVNGIDALKKLNENPGTDIVLMDIMMPEMNGYEAMKEIRKQSRFSKLPILSLTAKAMQNDKDKCIEAGANDYISKPVDIDKLVSMMRVWLS